MTSTPLLSPLAVEHVVVEQHGTDVDDSPVLVVQEVYENKELVPRIADSKLLVQESCRD